MQLKRFMYFTSPTHNIPHNDLCSPYTLRILMLLPYNYAMQMQAGCRGRGGLGEKCSLIYLYLYFVLRWPGCCGGRVSAVVRAGAGRSPRSFLGKASAQSSSGVRVHQPPSSHPAPSSTADTEIVPPPRPCHILTLRHQSSSVSTSLQLPPTRQYTASQIQLFHEQWLYRGLAQPSEPDPDHLRVRVKQRDCQVEVQVTRCPPGAPWLPPAKCQSSSAAARLQAAAGPLCPVSWYRSAMPSTSPAQPGAAEL